MTIRKLLTLGLCSLLAFSSGCGREAEKKDINKDKDRPKVFTPADLPKAAT